MEDNFKFEKQFINEGRQHVANKNQDGFNAWLNEAIKISAEDPGLLRQELIMDYFLGEEQTLILKLKEGITRENVIQDLSLG